MLTDHLVSCYTMPILIIKEKIMNQTKLRDLITNEFASPETENSLAKSIPMKYIDDVKKFWPGKFRYKYRGPSTTEYIRPQSHTVKEYATSFAIYLV